MAAPFCRQVALAGFGCVILLHLGCAAEQDARRLTGSLITDTSRYRADTPIEASIAGPVTTNPHNADLYIDSIRAHVVLLPELPPAYSSALLSAPPESLSPISDVKSRAAPMLKGGQFDPQSP